MKNSGLFLDMAKGLFSGSDGVVVCFCVSGKVAGV